MNTLPLPFASAPRVNSPRRPGRPAHAMMWAVLAQAKTGWMAALTIVATVWSGLLAMQESGGGNSGNGSALLVPMFVVMVLQSAAIVSNWLMDRWKTVRKMLRDERIADAEADMQGSLALKTQVRTLEGQLATAEKMIQDVRDERDSTVVHYKATITELRDQIAKQDARARDQANQIASLAETMTAMMVDSKATRDAVESTSQKVDAALPPPTPKPEGESS